MNEMDDPYSILIIEDDPDIAQSLSAGLERDGYRVHWSSQGALGIEFALEAHPHLVLLDVRLPDGSGFHFCRRMRELGLRMPVVMLTVQREEADKVLGLEMGADDYITKPFSLAELLSRVRAHLRRAYGEYAAAQKDLLWVGEVSIDVARAQALRGGRLLNLTPTEYRLLVYLAQRPGQALSRMQILEGVWGITADPEGERMVNVNISRLRDKIEPDPQAPVLLLTVPGIGYRLVR